MGAENVALVREIFEAWQAEDFDALERGFSPNVQWVGLKPEEGDCHGAAEVAQVLRDRSAQGVRVELEELIDVGDQVVAVVRTSGRPDLPPGERIIFITVTLRGGTVAAMQSFHSRDEALSAGPALDLR
ncbi:MAG TPA: nuclear transport factor 2 family protein [Thermoleophilaceae bacterium]